ncbi:hypothetical protein HZS_1622 [Henneguya salminicola]|nr:hypothetical protein HZS_1622 [Henneguya salminicola]
MQLNKNFPKAPRTNLNKYKIVSQNIETILNKIVDHPNVERFGTYFAKKWIKKSTVPCSGTLKVFSTLMFLREGRIIVRNDIVKLTENFPYAHPYLAEFDEAIGERRRYEHPETKKKYANINFN